MAARDVVSIPAAIQNPKAAPRTKIQNLMTRSLTPWGNMNESLRRRRCGPCELIFRDTAALEAHQEEKHGVRFAHRKNVIVSDIRDRGFKNRDRAGHP
jgi:hypothetical protein